MAKLSTFAYFLAVAVSLGVSAEPIAAQKGKTSTSQKGSAHCAVGSVKFNCPKGMKVLMQDSSKGAFLAQKIYKDYSYAVFVLLKNAAETNSSVESAIKRDFVPRLFPKAAPSFEWRDLEFLNSEKVSSFEVSKWIGQGFNKSILLSSSYRQVDFNGVEFYVGSIWYEEMSVEDAEDVFLSATGTTEGDSCDAVVNVVRSITKEKPSKDSDPCRFEIIGTPIQTTPNK